MTLPATKRANPVPPLLPPQLMSRMFGLEVDGREAAALLPVADFFNHNDVAPNAWRTCEPLRSHPQAAPQRTTPRACAAAARSCCLTHAASLLLNAVPFTLRPLQSTPPTCRWRWCCPSRPGRCGSALRRCCAAGLSALSPCVGAHVTLCCAELPAACPCLQAITFNYYQDVIHRPDMSLFFFGEHKARTQPKACMLRERACPTGLARRLMRRVCGGAGAAAAGFCGSAQLRSIQRFCSHG